MISDSHRIAFRQALAARKGVITGQNTVFWAQFTPENGCRGAISAGGCCENKS